MTTDSEKKAETVASAAKQTTALTPLKNLGEEVLGDIKAAWAKVEWFGEEALNAVEEVAQHEYDALKDALVSVGGEFLPKQMVLVQGWVADYKNKVGNGANPFAAAEYCIGQDALQEVQFLKGELSIGLQALSAAFLNNLF